MVLSFRSSSPAQVHAAIEVEIMMSRRRSLSPSPSSPLGLVVAGRESRGYDAKPVILNAKGEASTRREKRGPFGRPSGLNATIPPGCPGG